MTRAVALQMVDSLTNLGANVTITHDGPEWIILAHKGGGVTPAQMNNMATQFSVAATTETVRFV